MQIKLEELIYQTPEGYNVMRPLKAHRAPFHWRLLTEEEKPKLADRTWTHIIYSLRTNSTRPELQDERCEGFCRNEDVAGWLTDKWNQDAALILMVEDTAAEELVY